MKQIYLLTKNKGKLLAAQRVFSKYGIEIKNIEKDYPEIQAESSIEIAKHAALQAAKEFNVPVIREDHSLCLGALNNLPGPYISQFDQRIPVETMSKIINNLGNHKGYFELAAAYAKPNGEVKEYSYKVQILVSDKIKGNRGNWNKIIEIKKKPGKTLGETQEEDNLAVWTKNYEKIAKEIIKND